MRCDDCICWFRFVLACDFRRDPVLSDQPKPPLSVWLDRHADTAETLGFYSPKKESLHVEGNTKTFGPYVHRDQFLDQFMEMVNWRAEQKMLKSGKLEGSHYAAMKEIVKEFKEGKL